MYIKHLDKIYKRYLVPINTKIYFLSLITGYISKVPYQDGEKLSQSAS